METPDKKVAFLVISTCTWGLSAVPGILCGWSLMGVLLMASQEAKEDCSVSPKVCPFPVVEKLKDLHLTHRRTYLPQETLPGPGSVSDFVCTQRGEETLGHPPLLCFPHAPDMLEKAEASPSLSPLALFFCFIIRGTGLWGEWRMTPTSCLGRCDGGGGFCSLSDLVAQPSSG